jgi:hypothetical protein
VAFDPDIGSNGIKSYKLDAVTSQDFASMEPASQIDLNLIQKTFKLEQNSEESPSLYLTLIDRLDREQIDSYSFLLIAFEGDTESSRQTQQLINIKILDINDNSPIFEQSYYHFTVREDMPLDTLIGKVIAQDKDIGENGEIIFTFTDSIKMVINGNDSPASINRNSQANQLSYFNRFFYLDEKTGEISLKRSLNYEEDKSFVFIIEAKDKTTATHDQDPYGLSSQELTKSAYTTVEIEIVDINDNYPDISVSFLNTLFKNDSKVSGYRYDVYVREHSRENKFIAHVSITDEDSGENGRVDWQIMIDNEILATSQSDQDDKTNRQSILKVIKLNNNSFTLNIDNVDLLDRELKTNYSINIISWDHGSPFNNRGVYNFTICLIDINDNAPKFLQSEYTLSIEENSDKFQKLLHLTAFDLDEPGNANSQLSFNIKEKVMNKYFFIDDKNILRNRIPFDRENVDKYIFHIVVNDHGSVVLYDEMKVTLNIIDLNDNKPQVSFNTSLFHRFIHNYNISLRDNNSIQQDASLLIRVGANLPLYSSIIDFSATDADTAEFGRIEFGLWPPSTNKSPFKLDEKSGRLYLANKVERSVKDLYNLLLFCRDNNGREMNSLNTTIRLLIQIVDSTEYCIEDSGHKQKEEKIKFINRDEYSMMLNPSKQERLLFTNNFAVYHHNSDVISIDVESHEDLIEIEWYRLNMTHNKVSSDSLLSINDNAVVYRIEVYFNSKLTAQNISQLTLGKYRLRFTINNQKQPSCKRYFSKLFTLLIGNTILKNEENVLFQLSQKSEHFKMLNDDENDNDNHDGITIDDDSLDSYNLLRVRPATLMKSDYILLFILAIIIVITALLLILISIICFYSKFKKRKSNFKGKKRPHQLHRQYRDDNDDDADGDDDDENSLSAVINAEGSIESASTTDSSTKRFILTAQSSSSSSSTSSTISPNLPKTFSIKKTSTSADPTITTLSLKQKNIKNSKKLSKKKLNIKEEEHLNESTSSSTGPIPDSIIPRHKMTSTTFTTNNNNSSGIIVADGRRHRSHNKQNDNDERDTNEDDDEKDFMMLTSPNCTIRKFTNNNKQSIINAYCHQQQQNSQQSNNTNTTASRCYIYSSIKQQQLQPNRGSGEMLMSHVPPPPPPPPLPILNHNHHIHSYHNDHTTTNSAASGSLTMETVTSNDNDSKLSNYSNDDSYDSNNSDSIHHLNLNHHHHHHHHHQYESSHKPQMMPPILSMTSSGNNINLNNNKYYRNSQNSEPSSSASSSSSSAYSSITSTEKETDKNLDQKNGAICLNYIDNNINLLNLNNKKKNKQQQQQTNLYSFRKGITVKEKPSLSINESLNNNTFFNYKNNNNNNTNTNTSYNL